MCFSLLPYGKDWIDLLNALLTPTIAGLGILIARNQHMVNKNRLKSELFERRYAVYEKITSFLASIAINGRVLPDSDLQFLRDTKTAKIIFDGDIHQLTQDIYHKAIDLQTLDATLEGTVDEERRKNLAAQREIKRWFSDTLHNIEDRFIKFLKLEH